MESIGRDGQGGEEEEDHAGGTYRLDHDSTVGWCTTSCGSVGGGGGCYWLLLPATDCRGFRRGITEDSSTQHSYTVHSRARGREQREPNAG